MEAAGKRKEVRVATSAAARGVMNKAKEAREAVADAEVAAGIRPAAAAAKPKPRKAAAAKLAAAPPQKALRAVSKKEVAAGKPSLKTFQKTFAQEPGRARPPELRLANRKKGKRHGAE